MEGFVLVLKQSKLPLLASNRQATSQFTLVDFEKLWLELDQQDAVLFDDLDLNHQLPVNQKRSINVKDAKIENLKLGKSGFRNGLIVHSPNGTMLAAFDFESQTERFEWFKRFSEAASIQNEVHQSVGVLAKYCSELGLNPSDKLTKESIRKAYKRSALKHHPDRGGDPEIFDRIRVAQTSLLELLDRGEKVPWSHMVSYSCTLVRNEKGLGLNFLEDRGRRLILVKEVQRNLEVLFLSSEAEGEIRLGDVLVGIDNDVCGTWFLSRVRARLGPLRAPMGAKVQLRFQRFVYDDVSTSSTFASSPRFAPPSRDPSYSYHSFRDQTRTMRDERGARIPSEPAIAAMEGDGGITSFFTRIVSSFNSLFCGAAPQV